MKKVFQNSQWKRHSYSIAEEFLKNVVRRRRKLYRKRVAKKNAFKPININSKPKKLRPPTVFSFFLNFEKTLSFFNKLEEMIHDGRKIYIDMRDIQEITNDALIYLLSLLAYYRMKKVGFHVEGNVPTQDFPRKIVLESGFLDKVISRTKYTTTNEDVLTIETGKDVRPEVAHKVIKFCKNKIPNLHVENTSSLYATIIECMCNTKHHAYEDKSEFGWWLIALYNKGKINFTFVDNGYGIPATLKKRFHEKLKDLSGAPQDHLLIQSALNGEFRTKEGLTWRGKGLPEIMNYAKNNIIDNLVIISNKGYVNAEANHNKALSERLRGTLIMCNIKDNAWGKYEGN